MKKQGSDKILVFGHGQMAGFVGQYFENAIVSQADVTKKEEIQSEFDKYNPTVVINTAAKTNIDWCELNKLEAFNVNTLGTLNIWEESLKNNTYMCHFSSGCIFHSNIHDQIYAENSTPSPRCYYSWTKVWGENLLGKSENLLVLRPRVIVSSEISRRNTLAKWMTYSHFITDQNSITVIEDMFPILAELIQKRISGTFNIVNKGTISPYEVAGILKTRINPDLKIEKTTLDEVNSNLIAKRCSTILDTRALATLGYEMPPVRESIYKVIELFKRKIDDSGGLASLEEVHADTKEKYSLKDNKASTYSK